MRILLPFFFIVTTYAQAPKDWRKISEGNADGEKSQFLGSWKSPEGTVQVRATQLPEKDPPPAAMLGFTEMPNSTDIDTSIFPIQAETLKPPHLGIRFKLAPTKKLFRERIWLRTTTGGISIEIEAIENTQFSLRDWNFKNLPADKDNRIKLHYERRLAEMKPFMKGPQAINIDKRLTPPVSDSNKAKLEGPRLIISIHNDGRYSIAEKFHSEEQLLEAMKAAAKSDPRTTLHIRGDSTAEFKFARKAIKLGAEAGLSQVAFGSFSDKQ